MKGGSCVGKPDKGNDLKPADLERMSTVGLEKLLLQDFQDPESGEEHMEQLYYAAQLLAERVPDSNASADRAWSDFRENYLPFAEARSARYEDGGALSSDAAPGRRQPRFRRWGVRGMLAAAALVFLLLSVSVAAAASGHGLWELLARWTDETMSITPGHIVPVEEDAIRIPQEDTEYASLQEAVADCGLAQPMVPQWLPEGFELVDLVVDTGFPDALIYHGAYQREEECLVVLVEVFLPREGENDRSYGNFQKDEGDPIPYEAGGVTHLLSTNAGRPVALWTNGPAQGAVSGDITMDELKQIIDSIYE